MYNFNHCIVFFFTISLTFHPSQPFQSPPIHKTLPVSRSDLEAPSEAASGAWQGGVREGSDWGSYYGSEFSGDGVPGLGNGYGGRFGDDDVKAGCYNIKLNGLDLGDPTPQPVQSHLEDTELARAISLSLQVNPDCRERKSAERTRGVTWYFRIGGSEVSFT
ncbi:hypothetical protein ACS0TY_027510 [Phlomoides rotata]